MMGKLPSAKEQLDHLQVCVNQAVKRGDIKSAQAYLKHMEEMLPTR